MNHIQDQSTGSVSAQRAARESQFALAVASHLQRSSQALPHDIEERLRFARERAVGAAAAQRRAQAARLRTATTAQVNGGGGLRLGGPPPWWLRMASVLPLAVLVGGLVLIQQHHEAELIAAAVEIDSALLADELPPDAYGDPGFAEFLRNGPANP